MLVLVSDQTRLMNSKWSREDEGPICSLENILANVKGTHEYYSSKEPHYKDLKEGTIIFEKKNFFRPNFFQKPSIIGYFSRKNGQDKKNFWSESIQKGPKRILKRKSRFRKIISHYDLT